MGGRCGGSGTAQHAASDVAAGGAMARPTTGSDAVAPTVAGTLPEHGIWQSSQQSAGGAGAGSSCAWHGAVAGAAASAANAYIGSPCTSSANASARRAASWRKGRMRGGPRSDGRVPRFYPRRAATLARMTGTTAPPPTMFTTSDAAARLTPPHAGAVPSEAKAA